MANSVENLKKRALEISETKNELKEQKKINIGDLSIVDELFNTPLDDDSDAMEIKSLSRAVNTEQNLIGNRIDENQDDIDETSKETDEYTKELRDNVNRLEQMKKTSDLVNVDKQIKDTKTRIDELGEVKRILETDSEKGSYPNSPQMEGKSSKVQKILTTTAAVAATPVVMLASVVSSAVSAAQVEKPLKPMNGNTTYDAIYTEAPPHTTSTLEQKVEKTLEQQGFRTKTVGQIAKLIGEMADELAVELKKKDESEEIGEQSDALRGPGYGEYRDPP